jgi:hypothetical protein
MAKDISVPRAAPAERDGPVAHLDRVQDLDGLQRSALPLATGGEDGAHPRAAEPVEDRHFGAVDLHQGVGHAVPAKAAIRCSMVDT